MKLNKSSITAPAKAGAVAARQGLWSLAVLMMLINLQVKAQRGGLPETAKLNRLSLGVRINHLYDVKYTGRDLLSGGFSANDPSGLRGKKTKFDMAGGLDVSYFFSPLFSMDLSYDKGKMTGANDNEYYQSNVSFLGLGANVSLKRALHTGNYKLVPYIRVSISRGSYDAERKLIEDDVTFNKTKGTAMLIGFGAGVRYHINKNWHLNLMSEYVSIRTDAWDGYDYGTGSDQMIKTSFGIRYSMGNGKHVDQTPAFQDKRMDQVQGQIDDQLKKALKDLNDTVSKQMKMMADANTPKDSDHDGIVDKYDNCPNVSGSFSNNGCPEESSKTIKVEQVVAKSEAVKGITDIDKERIKSELLLELSQVRFGPNSVKLNKKALEQLNNVAILMRNNPSYNINVQGFTDGTGSDEYNKIVAESRVNSVCEYLTTRGIAKGRMKIAVLGKANPVDDNGSSIGKANNRRVEFKLEK